MLHGLEVEDNRDRELLGGPTADVTNVIRKAGKAA